MRSDENFEKFLSESTELAYEIDVVPDFPQVRKRRRTTNFTYEAADDQETIENEANKFKIHFYFTIIDRARISIEERFKSLSRCNDLFNFLTNFHHMTPEDLKQACIDLDLALRDGDSRDVVADEVLQEIATFKKI